MKNQLLLLVLIFSPLFVYSQVGIGTNSPDESSILDVHSNNKGILIPRLTSIERNLIENPSNGLLIFNTTSNNINFFNQEWKDFSPNFVSTNATEDVFTNSNIEVEIPEMILFPKEGTHVITFDAQISNASFDPEIMVNSSLLLADFFLMYNQLQTINTTHALHAATFGNGEILVPGKYTVTSAISIGGVLVLDGQNETNPFFIIQSAGAINFGANTIVVLINGATAENIFWVSEGASGVGADSVVHGNLISHGFAVAVGANCNLNGRMLTNSGAISFGPGLCAVPVSESTTVNMGSLQSFVIFTGAGAINNTGASFYQGNISSGVGATDSLNEATVNGTILIPNTNTNINIYNTIQNLIITFGIYQNDILIPTSKKKITCGPGYSQIYLNSIGNTLEGENITVKWKTDTGTITMNNRIFTAIKVQ
jgi:hypothetical protein